MYLVLPAISWKEGQRILANRKGGLLKIEMVDWVDWDDWDDWDECERDGRREELNWELA